MASSSEHSFRFQDREFDPKLVVIAENVPSRHLDLDATDFSLEMVEEDYLVTFLQAVRDAGYEYSLYNNPRELLANISQHTDDLVVPIWCGEKNRNRLAWIPSICESTSTNYVGADSYGRIICHDKFLAKSFSNQIGFKTPNGLLIQEHTDLNTIELLGFPLVVKPNSEGSSIGIFGDSIARNSQDLTKNVLRLREMGVSSIIAEEFVKGREVNISIVGNRESISHIQMVEEYYESDHSLFDNQLNHAKLKKINPKGRSLKLVTSEMSDKLHKSAADLFFALGGHNLLRIDGKFFEEEFYLIEITTVPSLREKGLFAQSYILSGKSYSQCIHEVIQSAALPRV